MRAKDIVVIVLLVVLPLAGYLFGYRSGQRRDIEMREARSRLNTSLRLYEAAQGGDLQKLQSDLGMVILGQTRTFERQFGPPTGSNAFVQRFATAQVIATQVESGLVPMSSILTNFPHTPDAKVTLQKER